MTTYNKLVRDRIPEIIRGRGGSGRARVLGEAEFATALQAKLREEWAEYRAASPTTRKHSRNWPM